MEVPPLNIPHLEMSGNPSLKKTLQKQADESNESADLMPQKSRNVKWKIIFLLAKVLVMQP